MESNTLQLWTLQAKKKILSVESDSELTSQKERIAFLGKMQSNFGNLGNKIWESGKQNLGFPQIFCISPKKSEKMCYVICRCQSLLTMLIKLSVPLYYHTQYSTLIRFELSI
jgi:hypothetical protein